MKDIAQRSNDINHLANLFWRAVSLHVDSREEREPAIEAFENLARHLKDTQEIDIKKAFALARRHIRYSVNANKQVFQDRYTLPAKIFHIGQAIAHYTETKYLP